ncbi:aldolase-type TIM barrel protein [Vibrio phage 1.081.O._10N.286.52.C2]|nr:aldolase-type TIM barrel protein [Vibrio phage 1.081.O._10N.286.52.C2]
MIEVLNLFVTHKCELSCSFCFSKNARERHPITNRDNIRSHNINAHKSGIELIRYCGGEPLEEFEFLRELILSAPSGVMLSVNTNARNLTSDMVEFFNEHDVLLQISVDGYDRGERPLINLDIDLLNSVSRLGVNQLLFFPFDVIAIKEALPTIEFYEVSNVNWKNSAGIPLEISHISDLKLNGINYFTRETTVWHHT